MLRIEWNYHLHLQLTYDTWVNANFSGDRSPASEITFHCKNLYAGLCFAGHNSPTLLELAGTGTLLKLSVKGEQILH